MSRSRAVGSVGLFLSLAPRILVALALACTPGQPEAKLYPSGVLVTTMDTYASADYAEEMARCVALYRGVPKEALMHLSITIKHGYAVRCGESIASGCYESESKTITIADQPSRFGESYFFPEILYHELTHWSHDVLFGEPGNNRDDWFFQTAMCF